MQRRFVRALLAPAALAAAIALAGCNSESLSPTGRALAPLSDQMIALLQEKHMDKDSPILLRIFKEESQLEVWKKNQDGEFALLKTYPICRWSGQLGPKKKEGDRQAPEGFYTITRAQMNPNSNYYLSFNTGYPNAFDRAWGRTGSELMVHGDCSSRGCYAMTDGQIQEIYALAREAFFGGQKDFQLQAYPFHMTALNMAKHRNNPNFAFWKELKEGYDAFEATHQEPTVAVCEKHYVFDAAAPEGATKPLAFNPSGACPAYRLDPTVAQAVLDYRRQEQLKMAQYIAEGVPTEPIKVAADGGMNPVFASKLTGTDQVDENGRVYTIADAPENATAVAQTANYTPVPATAAGVTAVQAANVPMPEPSPLARSAPQEKRSTFASVLGNLFDRATARASAEDQQRTVPPRNTRIEVAEKPRAKPTHTASRMTPAHHEDRKAVARVMLKHEIKPPLRQARQPTHPPVNQAAAAPKPHTNVRTAFSGTDTNGMLAGAQPAMPAGSFDARWSALH